MTDDVITRQREKLDAFAANHRADWYRIEAKAADDKKTAEADVYIYAEIGDNFWGEGVSAGDFVKEVAALDAAKITVHINSPGGNFWDSVAISNSLRQHPARVVTLVEGLAASGASLVAIAGDEVVMAQGSQMMVHEAAGLALGTAEDMAEVAAVLDKISANMAGLYAAKAGGTAENWREVQRAETWYNADEAVTSGLADRVDETVKADDPTARFNLKVFAHAGRAAAPAPSTAATIIPSPDGEPSEEENEPMSDELKKSLRERLGVTDESMSEEDLLAALDEKLAAAPAAAAADPAQLEKIAKASGAVLVDAGVWQEMEARVSKGEQAAVKLQEQERDQVINEAVRDGRIPVASVETWKTAYDKDPKNIAGVIAGLRKNVVPVEALGYADDDDDSDEYMGEFASLHPPTSSGRKGR